MSVLTGLTKSGSAWKPKFMTNIDQDVCLNCSRFAQICDRDVLNLQPMNKFGEFIDEDDDKIKLQAMTIANPENCADCQACVSIWDKFPTYVPLPA
ncbi:Ferredoxin-3 [Hyella patelloides LEGE 07179]|uniref:Ferredoxin-3 n=1 Tax=Hyella patelloides LEGE 07179 TaxID=945734 RepID=A0A563VQW5_9CYAN|nr:ferredoxin [Hyella patelloides]VEP13858.1 Ferredoxin-3 [Hyella patelloides LEGE 07179]